VRIKEETEIIEGEVVEVEVDRPEGGSVSKTVGNPFSLPDCAVGVVALQLQGSCVCGAAAPGSAGVGVEGSWWGEGVGEEGGGAGWGSGERWGRGWRSWVGLRGAVGALHYQWVLTT
jgi:hypothetical protein